MNSGNHNVEYEGSKLHFQKKGNGAYPLLLFHGFGQDYRAYEALAEKWESRYTLYLFDLYFHGQSTWNLGEQPIEKEKWKNILGKFLLENEIKKFSLLGFSLGAKFALASVELFPDRVSELFLLAPDGIKINFWYKLATYPYLSRALFKSMINHYHRFEIVALFAQKIGLVDKGVLRFVESQMDTQDKREKVYLSWVVFRHLKFELEALSQSINKNGTQVTVVAGKYDRVIPARNMKSIVGRLSNCRFEILETGHNGILRECAKIL